VRVNPVLEREGELVHPSAEPDPKLEITEIVYRTVKASRLALLGRQRLILKRVLTRIALWS